MTHAELNDAGICVNAAVHARLARFVAALLDENRSISLTATRDPDDAWALHVCDSLALLHPLARQPSGRLFDLGAGGGSPGIPLAIAREDLHVTLFDATRKKIAAQRRIAERLGLKNVETLWGRAESSAHEAALREVFDVVVARAVAPLPVVMEYAAGFVRPDGSCWFFESCRALEATIAGAECAARRCALRLAETRSYELPGGHGRRALVGYRKTRPLPKHLPRPPGVPKKNPL